MENLIELALRYGFMTHDDRENTSEHYFSCEDCATQWLHELNSWLQSAHRMYVQTECFNEYSWGYRVYQFGDLDESKGAPILHEAEAEFSTMEEALVQGLEIAFQWI